MRVAPRPRTRPGHLRCAVRLFVAFAYFGIVAAATEASAQPSETKVAAESMFATGKKQLAAGDFAGACTSFAESQRLDASVGALVNLGQCSEKLGRLATAWAAYREAASLAATKKDDRGPEAAKLATALEPKLAKLSITVKSTIPGMIVTRDGVQIGAIGVPMVVDAGEHVIEATAPGHESFTTTVKVVDQPSAQTVEIPELARAPEAPAKPPVPVPQPRPEPALTAPLAQDGSGDISGVAIAGFVVGGVGVAGLIVGGALGIVASTTASDAEDDPTLCPAKQCSPAGRAEIDSAKTQAMISTIGFAAGGALLGGGITMIAIGFAAASDESERSARLWVAPTPGGAAVGLEGSF